MSNYDYLICTENIVGHKYLRVTWTRCVIKNKKRIQYSASTPNSDIYPMVLEKNQTSPGELKSKYIGVRTYQRMVPSVLSYRNSSGRFSSRHFWNISIFSALFFQCSQKLTQTKDHILKIHGPTFLFRWGHKHSHGRILLPSTSKMNYFNTQHNYCTSPYEWKILKWDVQTT